MVIQVSTIMIITLKTGSYLEERLDLRLGLDLLLGHTLGDHSGVPVDAGDEGMAKGFVGGTFVTGLDDDGLAPGKSAGQDKDHLACFHNLSHFWSMYFS